MYKIYCDLDGVLVNFKDRFIEVTGIDPLDFEEGFMEKKHWNLVREQGVPFWSTMDWTPRGKQLWEYLKPFKPEILTSPSKQPSSKVGKLIWVQNNLGHDIKVNFHFSEYKHVLATPTSILIDDRGFIINNWKEAGGIAIHNPVNTLDLESVIYQLSSYLSNKN